MEFVTSFLVADTVLQLMRRDYNVASLTTAGNAIRGPSEFLPLRNNSSHNQRRKCSVS
jgi:hypothetical protein